eukprot:SAG25_NODE_3651_length_1012_cov_0.836802_2_plen_36_part_01
MWTESQCLMFLVRVQNMGLGVEASENAPEVLAHARS